MDKFDDQKNRDRSRRGDRPSRFSDINPRDRSKDKGSRDNRIFVSNIPYEYKWTEVKDLFRNNVGNVSYVELFTDENDKPRGCGIVEFSSPEYVKKALEVMHRYPLEGRKLVVKEDFGNNERNKFDMIRDDRDMLRDDKERNDNWNNSIDNSMEGDRNTYGLSSQFLSSINIREPLVNRVFVANLDYKVDKKKIKAVFKLAGHIRNVDLSMDRDGNSRGFAVIEYEHPVEAVQAISMLDKQMLFDRKLVVRMDRVSNIPEMRLPEGLLGVGPGLGANGEPLQDVARSVHQQQQQTSQNPQVQGIGSGVGVGAGGAGLLGAVPLGGLGLQALGQLGLGQLQSQLLQQQGLTSGDIGVLNNSGLGNAGLGVSDMAAAQMVQNSPMANNNMLNTGYSGLNSHLAFGRNVGGGGMNNNMNYSPDHFGDRGGNRNLESNTSDKPADMVVIRYLPSSVTWQLLREKFGEAGEVKFAEKIDNETAVIRFASEWGATRAIKMFDNTRIDGKTIAVRNF